MGDDRDTSAFDWAAVLASLEQLVVSGAHRECRERMPKIPPRSIPRDWAARFAELAYRVHLPLYCLKTLHRFVHPENTFESPATDREKVIYSTALFRLGDVSSARTHLADVDSTKEPEALFYQAVTHFYEWNYTAAVPLLRTFVQAESVPAYRRLVGKVNLVSALNTIQNWTDADSLLLEIEDECKRGNFRLLLGNSYELRAQTDIYQGRYDRALEQLDAARDLLAQEDGIYLLFVDKWVAICQAYLSRSSAGCENLRIVRRRAAEMGIWETIRDCDLFEAVITDHEQLLRKVIIGTPSDHFRDRARRLSGRNVKAQGGFLWHIQESKFASGVDELLSNTPHPEFDPGQKIGSGRALFDSPQLFALYDALTKDFYKPSNIGMLFRLIYPDEIFNPFSSPGRILQILKRLNLWFAQSDFPVRVRFKKSEFRLTSDEGIFLKVQRGKPLSVLDAKLDILRDRFKDRAFSTLNVAEALGISTASAKRLLSESTAKGELTQSGKGRAVQYRLKKRGRRGLAA
ncbi:MAG: hypothetical protein NDI61_12285 [Bdellovibrionaceae bacterium]|nr:hypothetical protein [Pseudobdellovibrionaceae bacterium]